MKTPSVTSIQHPTFQLLLACCQAEPDFEAIASMMEDGKWKMEDGEELLSLASRHGVLPLVYKALKSVDESAHPSIQHSKFRIQNWRSAYRQIAQRNMLMTAELLHVMKRFDEEGIAALAFKGPVLAQIAYGDITMRQYGDLDLLVRPQQLFETATLLQQLDYMIHGDIEFLNDPVWIEASKDMVFSHQKKSIVVELHWKLFHRSFAETDHAIDLWRDRETIMINQTQVPTLQKEILLAYLCIHGSRHLWERLEWVADIDRLIRTTKISWENVLKTAQMFQSSTMLLLGLSLSSRLFDTPLPPTIVHQVQARKIKNLSTHILELIDTPFSKTPSTKEVFKRKVLHASMQDTLLSRIEYWKGVLFQKNHTAILEENQPHLHHTLWDFSRPYKLFKKFVFTKNR